MLTTDRSNYLVLFGKKQMSPGLLTSSRFQLLRFKTARAQISPFQSLHAATRIDRIPLTHHAILDPYLLPWGSVFIDSKTWEHMEVSWNRGTPSYHPFRRMGFPVHKNHPAIGEPPYPSGFVGPGPPGPWGCWARSASRSPCGPSSLPRQRAAGNHGQGDFQRKAPPAMVT